MGHRENEKFMKINGGSNFLYLDDVMLHIYYSFSLVSKVKSV